MQKVIQIENVTLDQLENRLVNGILGKLNSQNSPSKEPPKERFLSRKEAAKMLGVSLPTLDDLSKNGILKFSRLGRIKRYKYSDLVEAMDQLSNKPKKGK